MKLRNWKNLPCPAATAERSRIGAKRPCPRPLSPVPDRSLLLLPEETFVLFLTKPHDGPGRPARQQKRAHANQQKQRHANDQARLLHWDFPVRLCVSERCDSGCLGGPPLGFRLAYPKSRSPLLVSISVASQEAIEATCQ